MLRRSPLHVAFGAAVRQFRHERGLSQEELALRCGLDRTYVGGIERGERNPSLTNIRRVAEALEVPPSTLFRRAEKSL